MAFSGEVYGCLFFHEVDLFTYRLPINGIAYVVLLVVILKEREPSEFQRASVDVR